MDTFTLILCVLAAVVLSSFLSRFLPKISTPLVQIALGVLATYLPFFPDTELDPELFMVLFIAPLLYLEAHEIDKSALFKSLKISLSLAIGLAIATMVAVGFTVHTFWPAIPLRFRLLETLERTLELSALNHFRRERFSSGLLQCGLSLRLADGKARQYILSPDRLLADAKKLLQE